VEYRSKKSVVVIMIYFLLLFFILKGEEKREKAKVLLEKLSCMNAPKIYKNDQKIQFRIKNCGDEINCGLGINKKTRSGWVLVAEKLSYNLRNSKDEYCLRPGVNLIEWEKNVRFPFVVKENKPDSQADIEIEYDEAAIDMFGIPFKKYKPYIICDVKAGGEFQLFAYQYGPFYTGVKKSLCEFTVLPE